MSNYFVAVRAGIYKRPSPWYLCFFLAYVSSFFLSGGSTPRPSLDSSYQAVLEYAVIHHFQFGKDIVFTFGPLGFLNTTVSQGFLPVQRILFALVWSGIVAWSVTGLARQIQGPMKFVFLVWFLVYSNSGGLAQHAFLVMIYGCMILMDEPQIRKGAAVSFLITFALLGLVKFTFFMAATISIIMCVLVHIGKRNIKSSVFIVTFYGGGLIALWWLAGQQLDNFWPWLKGSFEIVSGYTDAMTIFPKESVLAFGTISGAIFLGSLWIVMRSARLSISNVGILVVTAAYVFLSWKHGFVRADGHVIGFIFFLPLAYSALLNEKFQKTMHSKPRLYVVVLFMAVVLMSNWAADIQDPGTMLTNLVNWPRYMRGNSRMILNSIAGDRKNCFEALRENLQLKQPDLPIARSIVGRSSVDVINYTQWAALANNLNYTPRPVIQGYSVYTPYLQDLNLAFYESEQRPEFLLLKMETIDERFPALDDATLLPYVLGNYKPISKDGEYLVLQTSIRNNYSNATLTPVHEQTVAFGDTLNLPSYNNALLIMQVDIKPTLFGKITSFIFQSPILSLHTVTNGMKTSYRFIPAMAKRGLVISPLLRTNDDIMQYFSGAMIDHASSISFSKPKSAFGQLSDKISVKLYKSGIL